jgi:hypothetical protein
MYAYEVVEFSTDTCHGEEVKDGEMFYNENEDVRWQGEEEGHDPQNRLAAHLLILSEYRPGLFHPSRSSSAPPTTLIFFLLESMRRDVRILLVGDGTSFLYRAPRCQT